MGEHLHRLIVGNRGWRVPAGITASGAEAGYDGTHGPYVQLPPGRYRMTALVTPDAAAKPTCSANPSPRCRRGHLAKAPAAAE